MNTLEYILRKYGLKEQKIVEIPDMDRGMLAHLFHELGFREGAEIGVERAVYSKQICRAMPGVTLHCIDPWKAYRGYREHVSQEKLDAFHEESVERLKPYNAKIVRRFSLDAAPSFRDGHLDFVYLDGNHALPWVMDDICAWTPKVRKGGIVAGHDYIKRKDPRYLMHVVQAIHAYVDAYQIEPLFLVGSKEKKEGSPRDPTRSWFFVR